MPGIIRPDSHARISPPRDELCGREGEGNGVCECSISADAGSRPGTETDDGDVGGCIPIDWIGTEKSTRENREPIKQIERRTDMARVRPLLEQILRSF